MSAQSPDLDLVTPADVRNAKFQLIRRGGYDPAQVDPFLEVIAQTLGGGAMADPRINSEYIHGVRFTTVRRGGYLPAQVDAFLDRVIDTFDHRAATGVVIAPAAVAPAPAAPAPVPETPAAPSVAAAPEPVQHDVAAVPAAAPAPAPMVAEESYEGDFERLRMLHTRGVLSDKEFAVLGARVKRKIDAPVDSETTASV